MTRKNQVSSNVSQVEQNPKPKRKKLTTEEKIEALMQKKRAAERALYKIKCEENKKKRKADTREKIIFGVGLIKLFQEKFFIIDGDKRVVNLQEIMLSYFSKEEEKAIMAKAFKTTNINNLESLNKPNES